MREKEGVIFVIMRKNVRQNVRIGERSRYSNGRGRVVWDRRNTCRARQRRLKGGYRHWAA